jgi:cytochrome c-type biogenesis protein CcmE
MPSTGQRLRVGGLVVEGSVVHDQEELAVSFNLVDTGPTIKVIYKGLLPDLFREGQGIVATGKLVDEYTIMADEVLAKHDEEYMPPELAEALKGIKHEKPKQIYDPATYGSPGD